MLTCPVVGAPDGSPVSGLVAGLGGGSDGCAVVEVTVRVWADDTAAVVGDRRVVGLLVGGDVESTDAQEVKISRPTTVSRVDGIGAW